ncbi:3-dehydroquinate synthase [Pseudoalteromonas sp. T1lg65]|uniref:3-dehydroquinate synthase n=1 Tax=Pseudoalteromonas sp. T1lg65 TaxID=2077101 RepID=UPI003F78E9FC
MLERNKLVIFSLLVAVLMIASFLLLESPTNELVVNYFSNLADDQWKSLIIFAGAVVGLVADIVLPIPSSVIATYTAANLGFLSSTAAIWFGLTLGATLGYFIGNKCQYIPFFNSVSKKDISRASKLSSSMSSMVLITMRGVPVLAETSVIAAGVGNFPLSRFLLIITLSNLGIATTYSYIGSNYLQQSPLWVLILSSLAAPALFYCFRAIVLVVTASIPLHFQTALVRRKATYASATSAPLEAKFSVHYDYNVVCTNDAFTIDNKILSEVIQQAVGSRDSLKIFCVIDKGVADKHTELSLKVEQYLHQRLRGRVEVFCMEVAGGEVCKTQQQVDTVIAQMLAHQLDRHSMVIAIGGGALLDMVGFACAIFHRGIKLIRMPSTVLAQNDAGIGVKNGINAFGHKNFLGAFSTPVAVINDAALLNTLEPRDKRAGLAEAIKVALIKDAEFFDWLEENVEPLAGFSENQTNQAIRWCAQCHLQHITEAGDPFETGSGRPLDFGHWSAHKLESMSQFALRHGEAVAIGIALDSLYAKLLGSLTEAQCDRILELLQKLGFELWHNVMDSLDSDGIPTFFQGLEEFRQHLGGELSIPVLTGIGQYQNVTEIDQQQLLNAWYSLADLSLKEEWNR